ncbi:MAG: hypothetical protein ACLSBB_15915 [Ruthenibacterium lactatiformans]
MERIVNTELGVIREPLRAPFGFKGGTLSELWQTAVRLTLDSGASGMGVGVQSVLWSDPSHSAPVTKRAAMKECWRSRAARWSFCRDRLSQTRPV